VNPLNRHPGALIVIEGIDGAGSTTQAAMLIDWLKAVGIPAMATSEPSKGPIGVTARDHLARRIELGGPEAEALAFAADRMDHVASEIVPALERGITVVTDRYYLSSLAYQSLHCDLVWVRQLNRYATRPDLTVFLTVPADVGMDRLSGRETRERFEEDRSELGQVVQRYGDAIKLLADEGEVIHVIDGTRAPAEIHAEILALAAVVLETRYPGVELPV
jgi:dTMP kinase